MNDQQTTIAELMQWVREFSQRRDWEKFHLPKDLGVALASEVGEILEHFRYRTDAEIAARLQQAGPKRELAHELADGLWLLLRLADVCGVDLSSALREKLALADEKYPVEKVYGKPGKYTDYLAPPPTESTP